MTQGTFRTLDKASFLGVMSVQHPPEIKHLDNNNNNNNDNNNNNNINSKQHLWSMKKAGVFPIIYFRSIRCIQLSVEKLQTKNLMFGLCTTNT